MGSGEWGDKGTPWRQGDKEEFIRFPFPIPHSPFPIPNSQLPNYRLLTNL
nr:hypothetical protein [Hassalia byssoidea]